jgi:anti-sigma factor RsiW
MKLEHTLELELQAWVDGELSPRDASRVAALVDASPEMGALANELRTTAAFVSANEPEARLADSRDFYWSKIRREIERGEAVRPSAPGFDWQSLWRRLSTPLSGLALVAVLALGSFNLLRQPGVEELAGHHMIEVEDLSEDIGSISYKSQSENMFVVYLYTKDQSGQGNEASETFDDDFLQ